MRAVARKRQCLSDQEQHEVVANGAQTTTVEASDPVMTYCDYTIPGGSHVDTPQISLASVKIDEDKSEGDLRYVHFQHLYLMA